MTSRSFRTPLLLGAALLIPLPAEAQTPTQTQAQSQDQTQTPSTTQQPVTAPPTAEPGSAVDEYGNEEEIVVTGQRPRGSVIGDIPPEKTYDARDIRATGATSITELLDALAPEIGSARGRGGEAPVLLLNGQRISSFRELRDIPTEAIERVDILPEEVALKYGYRADQRVVNIVLRQRFRSTAALVGGNAATDGGFAGATGDLTRLIIQRRGRTTLNLHAEGNSMLTEAERNIILAPGSPADALAARSLIGTKRDIRGSATFNRQILGDVSATLNTELEHNEGRSLIGLGGTVLEPLARNTRTDTAHAGTTLNFDKSRWHFNVTGNADYARSLTLTDPDSATAERDRARSTNTSGDLTGTANGPLFKLPAGNATTTLTVGGNTQQLDSVSRRFDVRTQADVITNSSLSRTTGQAGFNLDLPISRRGRAFSALGNFTLNANAEVDRISDFGTLTTIGAGANLSPVDRLSLIGSWTREEGAPTLHQLGDPVLTTSGTRVFDFTTGQTVLVTATTGGNPDLLADKRNVFKLGANWQPSPKLDLRLRADFVHSTIDRPIENVTVTPTIEAAFPGRFVRDGSGQLVSVDLRPLNFDQARRDTLRVGFDFSKPLKSRRPSQSVIDQFRRQLGFSGRPGGPQGTGGPPPEGAVPPSGGTAEATPPSGGRGGFGEGRGGRGFGGRGGGFFGGGSRGRIQFSLTDTITFVDQVRIGPGLPVIDFLHGDANGSTGGTPRHQVQAQAGYFNNGLGARIGANWRSGTTVNTLTGDNLRFSPLATFDLRLFANPGDIPELVVKHPWLRGTQVRLEVNNVFNSRPKVHDATGGVPLSFQPDLLDPLGRTIMISFRKLFLPSPAFFRRQFQQERQRGTGAGGDE